MITKADHPKATSYKEFHMNMVIGEKTEETRGSIVDSDSNVNQDSDQIEFPIQIGTKFTKYYYNDEPDAYFIDPLIIESRFDWDQLLEEVTNQNTTTTITIVHKAYDDIEPPTKEDLEKAIAISNEANPIEITIPETQSVESPSWD